MLRFAVRHRVCAVGAALAFLVPGCARHPTETDRLPLLAPGSIGRVAKNRYQTPTGQVLTPAGRQVRLPGMRPQALALSPDGTLLAAAGRNQTSVLINPANGRVQQTVPLSTRRTDNNTNLITARMSFTGLVFAPDGRRIYLSNAGGNVWAFPVNGRGHAGKPVVFRVPNANAPKQRLEIPAGLAVSPDGRRLYVVGNLGNRLHEIDTVSGTTLRSWDTGVAPYGVVLVGGKAYVSNLGGRRPGGGELTAAAGKGTSVRVDPVRHIANEGSVTVIDLAVGKVPTEILAGLHASALAVSPDGNHVVVANSGSDTLTSDSPRSYPGGKSADDADALAWASSGFLWANALAHGKTFRNYGEWMISEAGWKDRTRKGSVAWHDFWQQHQTGAGDVQLRCRPVIESLRLHSPTNTVGWDLKVPDVMRAAEFIRELRQFETQGELPDLIILFLPNDHTGGTSSQYPRPGAQVADNDLALDQVVEAISHSRFWPETCLFAIEDDPQAGWDHVSGYRTTCYVVSPYTKRRQTVSTQYNQTSLVRTIELILGLPPMNHLDATATPMTDCFNEVPDLTPFTSAPNRVPLDLMNPDPKQVSHPVLREDAITSSRLPVDEVDRCPEDVLNRILWRAMKGPEAPYPEWAVKAVENDD